MYLLSKFPLNYYLKKQSTIETTTYEFAYSSARTFIEPSLDLRNILQYLSVFIKTNRFMFGDNRSIVDSSMTPNAKIYKRYIILSFNRVRKAIIAKIIEYYFNNGKISLANILSKN